MAQSTYQRDLALADRGASTAAHLAAYCVVAVLLMVSDHQSGYLDRVRAMLSSLVYPVYQVIDWPVHATSSVAEALSERGELLSENEDLRRRWLLAQAQLNRLAALRAENQRLRALLDSSSELGERVIVGELIEIDLDPFIHRVALNRGERDGIFIGQPVADAGGILGQVERVSQLTAFVRLITDPSHAIPVTVNRTGLRTIAYGTGHPDQLLLQDVPPSADIRAGDLLVTSGLGGRFPAGFPVGEVDEVHRDPGSAFLRVLAHPTAAIDRSREVLLVWPDQLPSELNSESTALNESEVP
ncbi:MAG: rod shape-determining protein MreC [Xanthomonadales bacterium]|nr:rod shape-determining protein MreC [Xanthomonadales bacterium]